MRVARARCHSGARSGSIDLIILDIGLPDISGFDLLRSIRHPRTTPIILLTARTAEIDRVLGLEIGADDYVAKPFSPRELAARVKAVLRRTQGAVGAGGSRKESEAFAVNPSKRTITFFGTALELRSTSTTSSGSSSSARATCSHANS